MVESSQSLIDQLLTNNIKLGTIPEQREVLGKPFPLVLCPAETMNFIQLQEYFIKNNKTILKAASEYGAVMFKGKSYISAKIQGFDIGNGEEWASILYKSGLKEMPYVGGAAVRHVIVGNEQRLNEVQVVTTNESPPSEPIPFHHELAQTPNPPSHICFYCLHNAAEGGSTPLLRSDEALNYLNEKYPDFVQKIEQKGVKYIRIVPEVDDPSSAIGRSWKSMFHVQTREQAETEMKKQNFEWEWYENGNCKVISQTLPAVIVSSNGNKTFFNQIIAAYTGWIDSRNDPKKCVVYGDNELLPSEVLDDLSKWMDDHKCAFKWNNGQFVIVDNTVAYHSRQVFTGKRKIFASIAKGTKEITANQTDLSLSNGDKLPSVGLGVWKIPKETCAETVFQAIKTGYRCIDSACDYGNEIQAGQGIKKALDEKVISRQDLFITSKLWNTFHRKEHVKEACLKTLKDLQLDYLDLYLIHFPIALKYVSPDERYPPEWKFNEQLGMVEDVGVSMQETYSAMEQLIDEGLVKSIGVANVNTAGLRDILNFARIKPQVLQIESHPYLTQEKLLKFCRQKGVAVTAFSNLGALSYIELGGATKEESVLLEENVNWIAKKYSKTAAQVVLRWGIQRGTQIIPKSSKIERLKENIDLFDFQLTEDEMKSISNLNKNKRYNDPGNFCEPAFGLFFPIYD